MRDKPECDGPPALGWCALRTFLTLLASGFLAVQLALASGNGDPEVLQAQAIQTVDAYKANFRHTGDLTAMLPRLRKAHDDLDASYQVFMARGNLAAAALSLLTIADVERMGTIADFAHASENQGSAAVKYRQAIELAKQANRMDYEFKAVLGLSITDRNRGDSASAIHHAAEALGLAEGSGSKLFLLMALDVAAEAEIQQQNLDVARDHLERATAVALTVPDDPELYTLYMDKGDVYERLGAQCSDSQNLTKCSQWFDLARSAYEQCLAFARNRDFNYLAQTAEQFLQDVDRQMVSRAIQAASIVQIAQSLGNSEKAEALLREALTIQEKTVDNDSPTLIKTLNALANLLGDKGEYQQAIEIYERVFAITEKTSGRRSLEAADVLTNLAAMSIKQAKYQEAESYLKFALELEQELQESAGNSLPGTLSSLGSLCRIEGKYHEAEVYYLRALDLRVKAFGTQNPVVATSLNDLAALYYDQGEYQRSGQYYERARAVLASTLGTSSAETATTLNNLALVDQAEGQAEKAKALLLEALEIRRKTLGPNHPDTAATLNNLAALDVDQGNKDEAKRLFEEAVEIDSKALGSDHPTTKKIVENLEELKKTGNAKFNNGARN